MCGTFADPSQTCFWTPKARRPGLHAHHVWAPNLRAKQAAQMEKNIRSHTLPGGVLSSLLSSVLQRPGIRTISSHCHFRKNGGTCQWHTALSLPVGRASGSGEA